MPLTSPGHIKKNYEVSSQASPFYTSRIFSSGMFGKHDVILHATLGEIARFETLSNHLMDIINE